MFTRPTLQEIIDRIEADIKTRIDSPASFLRRSVLKVLARVYAGAVHLLYGNIQYNKDQIFISTADTDYLQIHASEYGITRTAAVKATGQGTATGVIGTAIPNYAELQNSDGVVYVISPGVSIGAGSSVTVNFSAKIAGADGNDNAGTVLSFVSPIANITSTVIVGGSGIENGWDEESDDELRARILERRRQPPHGGADFDYVAWMLEVPGVTRAWCIPLYMGIGTIGCAFVRDGDADIIPSSAEKTTVRNYIISHADPVTGKIIGMPVTAEPGLYIIDISKKTVNLSISIYPNTSDIQSEVLSKLNDLIVTEGGAGQTIYLSEIGAVISAAIGENRHRILYPLTDISATTAQIHVLGEISWSDYNG